MYRSSKTVPLAIDKMLFKHCVADIHDLQEYPHSASFRAPHRPEYRLFIGH
jgi:hypothetical protein